MSVDAMKQNMSNPLVSDKDVTAGSLQRRYVIPYFTSKKDTNKKSKKIHPHGDDAHGKGGHGAQGGHGGGHGHGGHGGGHGHGHHGPVDLEHIRKY